MESNHRPEDYEPSELPLLHPATMILTQELQLGHRDSNPGKRDQNPLSYR